VNEGGNEKTSFIKKKKGFFVIINIRIIRLFFIIMMVFMRMLLYDYDDYDVNG